MLYKFTNLLNKKGDFFNYYMKRLETDSSFEVLIIASPSNFATEIILIFLDPAQTVSLKIVSLTTRFFRSK